MKDRKHPTHRLRQKNPRRKAELAIILSIASSAMVWFLYSMTGVFWTSFLSISCIYIGALFAWILQAVMGDELGYHYVFCLSCGRCLGRIKVHGKISPLCARCGAYLPDLDHEDTS